MANFNILWNLNSVVDSQHSILGVQEWIEVNSGKIPLILYYHLGEVTDS